MPMALHEIEELLLHERVESARGFIQHEKAWLVLERLDDSYLLAVAQAQVTYTLGRVQRQELHELGLVRRVEVLVERASVIQEALHAHALVVTDFAREVADILSDLGPIVHGILTEDGNRPLRGEDQR